MQTVITDNTKPWICLYIARSHRPEINQLPRSKSWILLKASRKNISRLRPRVTGIVVRGCAAQQVTLQAVFSGRKSSGRGAMHYSYGTSCRYAPKLD